MIADEMRTQAAAMQKQAEIVEALEEAHQKWLLADQVRSDEIARALAADVPIKTVAAAVEIPASTLRARQPQPEPAPADDPEPTPGLGKPKWPDPDARGEES